MQADLSLPSAHMSKDTFSQIADHVIYLLCDGIVSSNAAFPLFPPYIYIAPCQLLLMASFLNVSDNVKFGMVGWCESAVYLTSPGVQLILAYSWARPAILVAGKDRGGMFLFLHCHSCSSFSPVPFYHLFYYSISFLPFSGRRHKMTHKG